MTCLVRVSAVPGMEELKTTTLSVGTRFDFLNVTCTILPISVDLFPDLSAKQVERVRATFERLSTHA